MGWKMLSFKPHYSDGEILLPKLYLSIKEKETLLGFIQPKDQTCMTNFSKDHDQLIKCYISFSMLKD